MPGIIDPTQLPVPGPSPDPDDDIFSELFDLGITEAATVLTWEVASRCPCMTDDTKQPVWDCPQCGGAGVTYLPPVQITGIFRDQSKWQSFRRQGELAHGEARLTTPLQVKPGYTDRRVRDRFTIPAAAGDSDEGHVFYAATPATPFMLMNIQRAWRVQLQSTNLAQQLTGG